MSDETVNQLEDSALLSADRTGNGEFFIDDYSHLRLSYYQYRDDNISLDLDYSANQDSAYSTNASTNESCSDNVHVNNQVNSDNSSNASTQTDSKDLNTHIKTNPTISINVNNSTNSKVLNEEERRKLREYCVSQIPDLPHPSFTVASIIASASRKMNPANMFVYNNRIEQGNKRTDDLEMETFSSQRTSSSTE